MIFGKRISADKLKISCTGFCYRMKIKRTILETERSKLEGQVAGYLEGGEYEEACIRIRSVIHADERLKAYSLVEIYVSQIKESASYLAKEKEIPENLLTSVCTVLYSTRYLSADLEEIKQISSMLLKSFGSSINKTLGCYNLAGKLVNADALELGHTDGKVVHYLRQSDPQAEDKKTRIIKICNARNIQVNMQLLDVHVFGPGARVSVQQQAARSNAGQQTRAQADDSQPSFPSIPSDNNMRGGAPSGSQGPVLAGRNEKGKKSPNSSTKTHETVQKMRMNSSSEKTQQNSTTPRNQKENNGRKIKKVDDWEVSGSAAEPDDFEHTPPEGRVHYKPGWGPQMPPNHGTASFGRKLDNGGNYLAIKHHTRSASTISSHPSKEEEDIMSIVRDAAGERKPSPSSCSEALKGLNNLDF